MLGDTEAKTDPLVDMHLQIQQWKKMEAELVIYRIFAQQMRDAVAIESFAQVKLLTEHFEAVLKSFTK